MNVDSKTIATTLIYPTSRLPGSAVKLDLA